MTRRRFGGLLHLFALTMASTIPTFAVPTFAQWTEAEVDNVRLKEISPTVSRLTWDAVQAEACGDKITYSIHRGTESNFDASDENKIAEGITLTSYMAHEPKGPKDYYYRVVAIREPGYCPPPQLRSGQIFTYPLDLGTQYAITVGDKSENCKAISTREITCATLMNFHAIIASQRGHEFLIGCPSADYEDNNWTCVNLSPGNNTVGVHSKTLVVWDAGFSKINIKTGKSLGRITPEFSLLATLK